MVGLGVFGPVEALLENGGNTKVLVVEECLYGVYLLRIPGLSEG